MISGISRLARKPALFIFSAVLLFLLMAAASLAYSRAPIPADEESGGSFSFVVFGDSLKGGEIFLDLIDKVNAEKNISFAVHLGDFAELGEERNYLEYLEIIKRLKPKIYHVPGNHDLHGRGALHFKKHFGREYYSFDYRNAHFIVLNNALPNSFDRRQFAWLKKDLQETKKTNLFVFLHRPALDPSRILGAEPLSARETTEELMRLFTRHKVDYVFSGHLHGYAAANRDGIVYIVSGGAGSPLHLPPLLGGFHHYVRVDVSGDNIRHRVVRLDEKNK